MVGKSKENSVDLGKIVEKTKELRGIKISQKKYKITGFYELCCEKDNKSVEEKKRKTIQWSRKE